MNALLKNNLAGDFTNVRQSSLEKLREYMVPEEEVLEILKLAGDDDPKLRRLVTRKRFGEPNAYLRGHVSFFGRKFRIDRRGYIPDNYAQELVERVIMDADLGSKILEVGTGCGWISISLKCERPDLKIDACDIDPNVLRLAQENAKEHKAEIAFHESFFVDDVLSAEPDCIVANVPYGGDAEYTAREREERPQMPPISICDPQGTVAPLIDLLASVRNRGWRSSVYLETGYLDLQRLEPVIASCRHYEHVRNGDFGYLVIRP